MPAGAAAQRSLTTASLILGAVYLATIPYHPFPGSAAVKALSVAFLGARALHAGERLLALALLVSSTGDLLLDIDPGLFVPGLCAFLSAHVAYTVLFTMHGWNRRRAVLPALVVLYAAAFALWLRPSLGPMELPVFAYIAVITAMVSSSLLSRSPALVPAGAILFLASDSLLAAAKFKGAFPLRDYLVWATYYAAQYAITSGLLRAPAPSERVRAAATSR